MVNELLCADDPVLMSETMKNLKEDFGIVRMHWKVKI